MTNASRTLLMDLATLDWHEPSLELMGIPRALLPQIRCSSEALRRGGDHGARRAARRGHPRRPAGRALRPDAASRAGEAKNTYGTGCVPARQHRARRWCARDGLLDERRLPARRRSPPAYVLEGSIAVTGGRRAVAARPPRADRAARREVEELARSVEDNGGVYFVPAFSGPLRARTGAPTRAA